MQYLRSVQFIFDRQNWVVNVLLSGLCLLVPIVGPIVLIGYLFEIIDALKRDPEHKDYPDFNFDRLKDYLMRGVWPFLMSLVVSLIISVPLALVIGVLMAIGVAIAASTKSTAILLVFYLVMLVAILAVGLLSALVSFPAVLQAGLAREFNFGGMIAFVKDFNKRVFKEMAVSLLFLVGIGVVAEVVGIFTCGLALPFTFATVTMAQYHLKFQLYQLYLERGGTPIVPALSASSGTDEAYSNKPIEPDGH